MLEKYGGRPDVTEEDVRGCIQDVQALKDAGEALQPGHLRRHGGDL